MSKKKLQSSFNFAGRLAELGRQRPSIKGISIDSGGTRLIDDGLSIHREKDGWVLKVSIADAPSVIPDGQKYEDIAEARDGLLDQAIPINIFPPDITHNYISLSQGLSRPALTFKMYIKNDGSLDRYTIYPTMFRNEHQMSFDDVDKEVRDGNEILHKWALLMARIHKNRLEHFVSMMDELVSDDLPTVPDCYESQVHTTINQGHLIVTEAMRLTNEVAADYMLKNGLPAPYRYVRGAVEVTRVSSNLRFDQCVNTVASGVISTATHSMPPYIYATSPMRSYPSYLTIKIIGQHLAQKLDDRQALGIRCEKISDKFMRESRMWSDPVLSPKWSKVWERMRSKPYQRDCAEKDETMPIGILKRTCQDNRWAAPLISERKILINGKTLYMTGIGFPASGSARKDFTVFAIDQHPTIAMDKAAWRMLAIMNQEYPQFVTMPEIQDVVPDQGLGAVVHAYQP